MIFLNSFASMGYSAWNVAVAFFFAGCLLAGSIGIHRRSRALQIGFVTVLFGAFSVTIILLAPVLRDAATVNADWEARRETDEREIRRRQQFQPAPEAPGSTAPTG